MAHKSGAHKHLVSILICARNEERYLWQTLESLARQNTATELVVIDNASVDQTHAIALQFTSHVFRCEIKGKVPCLKLGIRKVSSPIVAVADADTIYPNDWASTIARAFETNPTAQIVFGPSTMGFESRLGRHCAAALSSGFVLPSLWLGVVCSLGFNMALRRETLADILSDFPTVAYSGWGIGTETLRRHGSRSVLYVRGLQVPKCMRRYEEHGMTTTTLRWLKEWFRLASGKQLSLPESDYYDR